MRKIEKYVFMGKGKKNFIPDFVMKASKLLRQARMSLDVMLHLGKRVKSKTIPIVCKFGDVFLKNYQDRPSKQN